MSTSEVTYTYDAATAFRAPGLAPLTEYTELGGMSLGKLDNVRPSSQRGKASAKEYRLVIVVDELSRVEEDESYEFSVLFGTVSSSGLLSRFIVFEPGQYVMIFDAATVDKMTSMNSENMFVTVDITGTNPSITFSAWLA